MKTARVIKISWNGYSDPCKSMYLQMPSCRENILMFRVPRSACVTKGDTLKVKGKSLYVCCHNGEAQILPIYSASDVLQLGELTLPVLIKEITEPEEYMSYSELTSHHYRGKSLFGRHAPLVLRIEYPLLPSVAGYIELATAFFTCGPRRKIFDVPCQLDNISWKNWNMNTAKDYISLFVRIARCVVHPELRGTGVGQLLIKHATEYAKTHWQSGGWRPYVLEISADMLKYVPFAEKAGMIYIGATEGNLQRIVRDLDYLIKNRHRLQNKEIFPNGCCGIVDAKLSQFRAALEAYQAEELAGSFLTMEHFLASISQQTRRPTLNGYARLKDVLVFPKPVYVKGLHPDASEFIERRVSELKILKEMTDNKKNLLLPVPEPINDSIKFIGVSLEFTNSVRRTKLTHQVERSFGLSLDTLSEPIFRDLTIDIAPGEIWLVTGMSGTGKSTLLRLLTGGLSPTNGHLYMPSNVRAEKLEPICSNRPLIEVFSNGDIQRGLHLMNYVGLSEAFLYVKPFQALSVGQKYRAMLALLLSKNSNLWIIDDFCENLDPLTARLITAKLSFLARKRQATLIVATSNYDRCLNTLQPDKVLLLTGTTRHRTLSLSEFQTWIKRRDLEDLKRGG